MSDKPAPNVYKTDLKATEVPYMKCLLCNTPKVAMLSLSVDHAGTIFLCKGCEKHLREALQSWR